MAIKETYLAARLIIYLIYCNRNLIRLNNIILDNLANAVSLFDTLSKTNYLSIFVSIAWSWGIASSIRACLDLWWLFSYEILSEMVLSWWFCLLEKWATTLKNDNPLFELQVSKQIFIWLLVLTIRFWMMIFS